MVFARLVVSSMLGLALLGCASTPPRQRTEFEDIPVPKGLTYQPDESTVIESPSVKAGRFVYRGRVEPESLAEALRSTLEANGWRTVSSTRSGKRGAIQVYEKAGTAMQAVIYESWWYTYVEIDTTRITTPPQ